MNSLPIEKQVTSLELSKRLKELGVEQESLFYWSEDEHGLPSGWQIYHHNENLGVEEWFSKDERCISAFTASELLDLLPQTITIKKLTYQIFISAGLDKQFFVVYADEKDYHDNFEAPIIMRHNLCETLARMLIYLLEQGLMERPRKRARRIRKCRVSNGRTS